MTVRDLIALLEDEDPDRLVVMSIDPEGNGFQTLGDVATSKFREDYHGRGDIGLESLTDDDRESGYSEEDVMEGGVPALVLWPA